MHSKNIKAALLQQFGNIDIYLFDQLLKGRFDSCGNLLDAGCGNGRNLHYFLKNGFDVYAVDSNADSIEKVRRAAAKLAPQLPPQNFKISPLDKIPFDENSFDAVLCNAVLHFADNESHFLRMLEELWRVLKPGGFLFVRLASSIGLEKDISFSRVGHYKIPDGSERFLVDLEMLLKQTERLGGTLLEPVKTTNVQGLRCMTTWCVGK